MKSVKNRREENGRMRDVVHLTMDAKERRDTEEQRQASGWVCVFSRALPTGFAYQYMPIDRARDLAREIGIVRVDGVDVRAWALTDRVHEIRAALGGKRPTMDRPNVESWETTR